MAHTIALLPGDGIGPEVIAQARRVLAHVGEVCDQSIVFTEHAVGGCAIDAHGTALPHDTFHACRDADAILLGAVGGPAWDDPQATVRPEQGLLGLRKGLSLFANLRPVKAHPALEDASPLKAERLAGIDILVVRELTGGVYFGEPRLREAVALGGERAVDTIAYQTEEIQRVVRLAFNLARLRKCHVTSVDKANILATSQLWRDTAADIGVQYSDVALHHQLVDSAAMRLITHANEFDVIVTSNMFGDILTDEASVLTGSLGMLPSASLGATTQGMYEPCHGSAPDIAGRGIANPLGTILSAAMLLRHSLALPEAADMVEIAVHDAVSGGARTKDLGGALSTRAMGDAVCARLG